MSFFNCSLENDDPKYPVDGHMRLCKAIVHRCIDDLDDYTKYMQKTAEQRRQIHATHGVKAHQMRTALGLIFPAGQQGREWSETVFTLAEYNIERCQQYVRQQFPWVEREI
jgi:hypothetical protein